VPIYISGTYDILKKDSFHISPGRVECIVADPIPFTAYAGLSKNDLSEKIHAVLADIEISNRTPDVR
jgi:1-acyl-sn-glycerol-3-phosphate acyltransferase